MRGMPIDEKITVGIAHSFSKRPSYFDSALVELYKHAQGPVNSASHQLLTLHGMQKAMDNAKHLKPALDLSRIGLDAASDNYQDVAERGHRLEHWMSAEQETPVAERLRQDHIRRHVPYV